MKRLLLHLLFHTIFLSVVFSQDMIIIPKVVYRTTNCTVISADKQQVIYKTPESNIEKTFSTDVIARINFGDSIDHIVQSFLIYDTIHCEILAINPENIVYFSEEDHVDYTIPKSNILVCYFGDECTNSENEKYLAKLQQMQDYAKSKRSNIILKKDGGTINTSGVIFDEETFYFSPYKNGVSMQTFIDRNKVKSFIYSTFIHRNMQCYNIGRKRFIK